MRVFLKWANRHSAAIFGATLLFALCGFTHFLALEKMGSVGRQFPIMNLRTEHSMALIDFLNSHRSYAAIFILVFIGSLLYLELRDAPRWSVWLVFFLFAAPCIVYLIAGAYVSNKF